MVVRRAARLDAHGPPSRALARRAPVPRAATRGRAPFLDAALRGGVDVVQLRDKRSTTRPGRRGARLPRGLPTSTARCSCSTTAPSWSRRAAPTACTWARTTRPCAQARASGRPGSARRPLTHSPAQVDAATGGVDYIAVGPVHETPTKPGRPAVGLDARAPRGARSARVPWFAIGGIDAHDDRPGGCGRGARAMVVVRAITEAADPGAAARALREALDAARCTRRPRWGNVAASDAGRRGEPRPARSGGPLPRRRPPPEPWSPSRTGWQPATPAAGEGRRGARRARAAGRGGAAHGGDGRGDRGRRAHARERRRLRRRRAGRATRTTSPGCVIVLGDHARRRRRDVAGALLGGARLRGAARHHDRSSPRLSLAVASNLEGGRCSASCVLGGGGDALLAS